jgi:hypothetical protein
MGEEAPFDGEFRSVPPEWESIDLIVMDIEGSEVAAMRDAHRAGKKSTSATA